jgi:hypothetical protein
MDQMIYFEISMMANMEDFSKEIVLVDRKK